MHEPNTLSPTISSLICRFQAADETALAELMALCQNRLVAFVSNRFPSLAAEDVCQVTWTNAWASRDSFRDGSLPQFRAWLFTIASNEAKSQLRKRRMHPWPENFDAIAPEADHENDLVEWLKRCIQRFQADQNPFVLLLVAQMRGETMQAAAERLDIPQGTVASQRSRGKILLRGCIEKHAEGK